jgi:3-deoxy-D-manno-octulosonic-acid transferase
MRFLYDIFFILFAAAYLPSLLLRKKLHKGFGEKFGAIPSGKTRFERPVWIHAVSVGEAAVAARLAHGVKKSFPDIPVVVSTTTRTGNIMAKQAGGKDIDAVFYYPFDISFVVDRVVRLVSPRLYIMVETELWPNLLASMKNNGVPVALVNGRISDRSYSNYMKIRPLVRGILRKIDSFFVQTAADARRLEELGAPLERTVITGNMKFDKMSEHAETGKIDRDSLGIGTDDKVIVAGSTHFPEERVMIDIFAGMTEEEGDVRMILAPRHIERVEAIKVYMGNAGLGYDLFSDISGRGGIPDGRNRIVLVDTIGHLRYLYRLADVVFVGGSIARRGGQNPLEPARCGKPVIFGPHMYNFREISDMLLREGAALRVEDESGLESVLRRLLSDDAERRRIAEKAAEVMRANAGATGKTVSGIVSYIGERGEAQRV